MPEAVTVWMVDLGRGHPTEIKGELSMARDALVFMETTNEVQSTHVEFRRMQSVRRVRGSPVLLITHQDETHTRHTAFYFAPPPPLAPSEGGPGSPPSVGPTAQRDASAWAKRRISRRHRRGNY